MKKLMICGVMLSFVLVPAWASAGSALDQLKGAAAQNESAASSSNKDTARSNASGGFDKASSSTSTPQVQGNTVRILRNSDGTNPYSPYEGHAIRHTPPPMPQ